MASTPYFHGERRRWWFTNRKIVEKYLKDARILIATRDYAQMTAALSLLDAALALSPLLEAALELKARSLLHLRRFKDVADMLQGYIPSYKMRSEEESSSSSEMLLQQQQVARDRVKLLPESSGFEQQTYFKCFSVSYLKKKIMSGLSRSFEKEAHYDWRYLVLGEACFHLGLLEDAMALLQTGKRLSSAVFRRRSTSSSQDTFPSSSSSRPSDLLPQLKLVLRRRTSAVAALDAGLPSEAIRHLSKLLDGRRSPPPPSFLVDCYVLRSDAFRASGRLSDAIADCNRALSLDPSSVPALSGRAALLESIRSLPDCLRDLGHLKLLYDAFLRDRKPPGSAWRPSPLGYSDVPTKIADLTAKIAVLRDRLASSDPPAVDFHALLGLCRGCTRAELERSHRLLCLRHRPDRAAGFVDRCELVDGRDVESVREQARMSALLLYRLIQKGYSSVMAGILDEEAVQKERAVVVAGEAEREENAGRSERKAFQGVFCRDMALVGNLISQVGLNRPFPVKYEALSC